MGKAAKFIKVMIITINEDNDDMKEVRYAEGRAFDKDKWRSCCGSNRPIRASMEKRTL